MQKEEKNSYRISNEIAVKFSENPNFPFLISFPRTGSHWLRLLMELYFVKPSLVRAFYYFDATDFTCYHRHDEDLSIQHQNVIYLYRDIVPTVFSQMNYCNENTEDIKRILYWTEAYAKHLEKWLVSETFTKKKTVLKYERLVDDIKNEFKKICMHFNADFKEDKLVEVSKQVSKEKLKEKTVHDKQVVNIEPAYEKEKSIFYKNHFTMISDTLYKTHPLLEGFFN